MWQRDTSARAVPRATASAKPTVDAIAWAAASARSTAEGQAQAAASRSRAITLAGSCASRVSRAVRATCSGVSPREEASSMLASVAALHDTSHGSASASAPRVAAAASGPP